MAIVWYYEKYFLSSIQYDDSARLVDGSYHDIIVHLNFELHRIIK